MFVIYLRVSTQRQGVSGLGLEAQKEAVTKYAEAVGEPIIATFTEIEGGSVKDRPQLVSALDVCRRRKAVLLIARLDRLSRSLAFVAQLLEANVDIRAADVPEANRMMIQMLAVFAEHERSMIRDRTKAALAAAKARGVRLGANGAVLAAKNKRSAHDFAETVRGSVEEAFRAGATTNAEIAERLNQRGVPSRECGRWHTTSVARLMKRLQPTSLPSSVPA
jgi:DNA invertase Pin-like site-specific DNA recombinase